MLTNKDPFISERIDNTHIAHSKRRFALGIICACFGALCWGLSGTCAQFLFEGYGISVPNVTLIRNLVAAFLFFIAIAAYKRKDTLRMLRTRRNYAPLFAYGATLFLTQLLYMSAIDVMNAGTVTVLQMIYMIYILVFESVKGRRLPSWQSLLGFVLAMGGTVLIATQGDVSSINIPIDGLVIILIEAACVAGYILIPKRLIADYGSLPATGVAMLVDAVLSVGYWFAFSAVADAQPIPLDLSGILVLVLGVGFFGTFMSFLLYMYGVGVVGSVTGGLLGAIEPVGAMVASAVWLGTAFTGWDWIGMVFMLGMLVCVTIPSKKNE